MNILYEIRKMQRQQSLAYAMRDTRGPLVMLGSVLLFISIQSVTAVTVAGAHEFDNPRLSVAGSRYCDFAISERLYNITDLLLCMNELASTAVAHSRNARSSDGTDLPLVSSRRAQYPYPQYQQPQYNYPSRPGSDYQSYYDKRPSLYFPGLASPQTDNSGYYDGGTKYPYSPETPFAFPGGAGAGLFDALTSISQYDDLKCVPRLLCEVATGVIPGNSGYKQSYDDFGGNSLIRLLTALDIGGSSPLLTFGKSALTGYTSRGNPSVCYREYPKCPRNNADLVNYLNNHNGGFFRFFSNNRGQGNQIPQGNYYRGAPRREPAPPPGLSGPEADRTGTGELKFDSLSPLIRRDFAKSFFPEKGELNESNKVVFPQEPLQEQSLNRVSKSLSGYQETANSYQNPSFFLQDRKDQEANMLYGLNMGVQMPQGQPRARSSRTMESPKARLYLPDDPSNETISTFTFPDGQKVQVNVAFSKLFSEGYKKALRRSFANDHSPQPVNFEGFSMVNLAELYPNDRNRLDLQVVHPCDMICHDSKGIPVQFSQILLHSGSLSTLMVPDQPILDLSNPLPCEVMCIDRRGERRRLSTTLNQVLRTGYDRSNQPDFMGLQDNLENQEFQWLTRQQRRRNLHNREASAPMQQTRQFPVSENINQLRSIEETRRRMTLIQKQQNDHQFGPVSDRREFSQPQSQLHAPKPRNTRKTENNANGVNLNDRAASMPEGSIIIGGGPIPYFGPPMPFMGLDMSQGGPGGFVPQRPLGLAMASMQGPPMPPEGGIVQSFGMMPMFPGMMPMIDPLSVGLGSMMSITPPPTIVCLAPSCSSGAQSPARALVMCGDVLYFIPYNIFGTMPVCAVSLETGGGSSSDSGSHRPLESDSGSHRPLESDSGSHRPLESDEESHILAETPQSTAPSFFSTPAVTEVPDRSITTVPTEDFEMIPIATTHKFRQPEGEDYPQVSCLEGESWNLEVHECVPIKYDKDIETDYTHLPGSPWSGVTRKPIKTHKLKKRKKLVIITDKGNITYIKAA